jgi:hypothetical protein
MEFDFGERGGAINLPKITCALLFRVTVRSPVVVTVPGIGLPAMRRVVDGMVDTGCQWIVKLTYFLIPPPRSLALARCRTATDPPCRYVSSDYVCDDDTCGAVLSASARLSCGQLSMGFFDGVLHTLPTLVLSLAPIRAWPGWMPVERSSATVSDDSCL